MPSTRIPRGGTMINTISENDYSTWDKRILRAPVVENTVQVAHMKEINVLFSSCDCDGMRGNRFKL